ncbi:hypothetical protein GCT19_25275 [Paraburkholderia sp. CNPSo 3155]|uniref:hypothetical protein n=1 Tax=Paraburkholderia atlantica TaxID=2654982 RepID=UPI00128D41FF|nr:hypothetical protein [Paraburkholderia atlantica]MPW08931.1 hypothetical protein [Paraburkholderia atlantica]
MSLDVALFYRRAVSGFLEAVRQRMHLDRRHAAGRARSAREQPRDDPERLERIATYARAGYFNMCWTFE